MKKNKEHRHLEMCLKINELMENNLDIWSGINEIRKAYDEFVKNLKRYKDLQPDLQKDLSYLVEEWEEKRKILVSRTFPVSNILLVYSEDHDKKPDPSLGMGWEAMKGMKDKKLLKAAGNVLKKARKYHKQVFDSYGLTGQMIDLLGEAYTKSHHAYRMKSDMLTNRKRTQKKSDLHYKALSKLLKKRLDKLMTIFSGTHPTFYGEYVKIRQGAPDIL